MSAEETGVRIQKLEREMRDAARDREFERAAALRDAIRDLREKLIRL
jgi:excinuclease ABC subunit B